MKHSIDNIWLAYSNRGNSHIPWKFWSSCEHLIHHSWQRLLCSLNRHIAPHPPSCTNYIDCIEPIIVIIFGECNPISFKHTSSWYSFLEPQHTTYHSCHNILQLLGCMPWDRGSCEHNSLWMVGFRIYKEHWCRELWTFRVKYVHYQSFSFKNNIKI